jgi:hypothetical protein
LEVKKSLKKVCPLVTAVVVDDLGQPKRTAQQEIKYYRESFVGFCKPVPLRSYTPASSGEFKSGTDLVLYDFGGLVPEMNPQHLNPRGDARHLIEWAEDNPNALIVVVSQATFARYVMPEMRGLGLMSGIHNIILWAEGNDPIPDWFKYAHGIKGLSDE